MNKSTIQIASELVSNCPGTFKMTSGERQLLIGMIGEELSKQIYLTGFQIKNLAAMTDGDDECELCLQEYPETVDEEDGEIMPAGLYAYYYDYPDEGRTYLPPAPDTEEHKP